MCLGTDPDRNFDIKHGGVGSTNDPCYDTYHGGKAFSDAESKAIRTNLKAAMVNHNKKVAYVSVHSYSQLWMFPNGYTKSLSTHHSDLKLVANEAIQALR